MAVVRRLRQVIGGAAAILGVLAAVPAHAVAPECRMGTMRQDSLAALGARGEMLLASGDRVVLDGIRWPAEDDGAAREAILRHRGRALSILPRGDADRWGRTHVDAAIADEAVDLAGTLVGEGLAPVDAGERDSLCRPALLTVEAAARAAGIGLWRAGLREGRDGVGLRAATGRFVVAQGRVLNVGERPSRTYLDFARRGEDGLTVTVSKRTWRQLRERGLTAGTLRGRVIRARGVVELWRSPTLDIASADMIEILDEERALRR